MNHHKVLHSRGGVDTNDFPEDSNYWSTGAFGALTAYRKLLLLNNMNGEELSFWNKDNTWKTICLRTEEVLEQLRNKLREQKAHNKT